MRRILGRLNPRFPEVLIWKKGHADQVILRVESLIEDRGRLG